ncbi:MAG: glycosyltransferase family 2 protein [Muribaculaceae bacterium]|nr:glycosyltransferase family 2 protein [Muribaculaceae bacterium]
MNRLTLVIPVYNRANVVTRTLASVEAQTARDFDIILVDNNSTDGSADVLRSWCESSSRNVRMLNESRKGAASARRCGAEAADTEWLMFFDSDDVMAPGHIARILDAIESSPDADVIGWDIMLRYGVFDRLGDFVEKNAQYRSLLNGTMGTQRYCVRRSVYERAGGWCPEVSVWDDIELGARILDLNPKIAKLKGAPMVDVYLQPDSITHGESARNYEVIERALTRIAATLGPERAHWVNLKRIIVAAKEPDETLSKALLQRIIEGAASRRALLRFAYFYTRRGGRGIARLLQPFM